ncbi:MAG: IS66 family transposase, partial [Acetobacteraceae bacterium]
MRILIVDDEPAIRRFLRAGLRAAGHLPAEAETAQAALAAIGRGEADLVVLDLGLPDLDGIAVIERLRAVYAIEAEIRGRSAEERQAARSTRTAPLMTALRSHLSEMEGQLFSQSKLSEAITYVLNHWDGLTLFLSDGRVEVD